MSRAAIYTITNLVNGKVYVGSSVDALRRLYVHRWKLRRLQHDSRMLQRSWNKHGEEAFSFDIIEDVADVSRLLDREQYWIDSFKSADGVHGYNACPTAGTRAGVPQPQSVKDKMRAFHTGKPKSGATRLRMSIAAKGRKKSESHKQKLRESALRQFADPAARQANAERQRGKPSPFKGKRHSPEMIAKFRAAHAGRPRDAKGHYLPRPK
jgi:group I intron endonuclease